MVFDPTIYRLAVECANHFTVQDLFQVFCVDSGSRVWRKFFANSPGACLKVDKRSEFLRNKEKLEF